MKVHVVIPFVEGPQKSIELRYALRSIEKNLKCEEKVIWLYGEAPTWIRNVQHIPVHRNSRFMYSKFFDQLWKIELASRNLQIDTEFLYTYDDLYFMKPVTVDELRKPRALTDMAKEKEWFVHSDAGQNWISCMIQTLELLMAEGLPIYNYETHLPRVYNQQLALSVLERYDSMHRAFQFATMYFNYYEAAPILLKDELNFKLGIYHPIEFAELFDFARRCTIMNVATAYEDSLRLLKMYFPDKSIYEND